MSAPESETAVLDFDGWLGSQDPDTRRGVEQILTSSANPEAEKQKIASMLAVHEAHPEIDLPTINKNWDTTVRAGFAEQRGGPWQAVKNDDTAFHGLLVQQAQKQRDERRLLSGPDDAAASDAPEAKAASLENLTFNAAVLGRSAAEAFKTWQQTAQTKPGFDPGRADTYFEQARALHDSITQRFSPVLELADDAFRTLSAGKDLESASERLLPQVDQLSDAERRDFLAALRVMADNSPDQTKATFWGNFAKQSGRDIAGTGRGFMDALSAAGGAQAIGDAGLSEMSGAAPEGFQRQLLQDFGKSLREHNLESDLRRVQETDFSPVRDVLPQGWRWTERGAYAAPGAVAFTVEGLIPGVGMPALFGTMASQAYEQERFRLTDAGLNDAEASRQAATLAPIIAAPQAALMELRIGALAGKFPALKSAMTALADKAGGGLAGYGVRAAGHAAAQLPLLQGMSLMQPTVEAAAAALDKDMPGVNWKNGENGVLDGFWARTGESFVSLLPLVLAGAAFSGNGQAEALRKSSDTQLRAFGAKPEDISTFRAAVEKGPASAIEAAQKLMENRDGNSEAAKAAAEELTAQERQRAAMNDASLKADTREAGVSKVVRSGDGWTLIHDDGTRTQAGSDRAAVAIVSDLKQAATRAEAAALVSIIDHWHEAAPEGTQRETTLTGETARSDGGSIVYTKPGAGIAREVTDGATLDALRKEARMDALGSGNQDVDVIVNGSNDVQFRERVADGAAQVVQRLELNQSESAALTALHEQIESAWRTGIAQGTISPEETRKAVGSIAPALDPARARNEADRSFRERVQRVAEGKADETEVRETVSELAVADVIGRRRDGGAMPAGSITAALDAAVSNSADPAEAKQIGRFRAFLRSARQLLRGVLGTVAAIKKAKREGGAKELGELVNKLTGLDEQAAHNDALAADLEHASGLPEYHPPTPEEEAAGIAFSVSRPADVEAPTAYGELVKETGFPAVSIGHLAERSSVPLEELKARILAGWRAGRVVLSQGDWSHADEATRAGAVHAAGDRYLQARWLAPEQAQSGPAFSLAPSTPERDARPLAPVTIPEATLSGDRSDWRRAVRSFITANLQGRTLLNRDTGAHVGFTGESKSQSVGKLRAEPHFRAAMELPSIVENAVLLGDVTPRPERSGGTERFQYFAIPVTIGDKSATAWFNTRKQLRGGDSIFYQFGLHETEAAQTSPGLGTKAEPSSNTPTLGPGETVGAFLARIKDTLPAAMKVADVQSFSVSPGSRLEAIQRRIDSVLAEDPTRRRELRNAAAEKLQRLRSEMETTRYTPKGDEIRPLVDRRSAASLDKEQAFREADRAEELTAEGMSRLSPSTMRALEHGEQKLHESVLVGTMLSDHGKLVSKSRAAREGRFGEYDDAPWLPAQWYAKSGGFMPDEMASALHAAGLLREGTPEALWSALASEIQTIKNNNAAFEKASAQAKEIEQQARNQAKEAASEWRRQEDEKQAKDHSPKARLVRDLRTLDSVLSVFPAEVRARVGGFVKLAQLGSDKARLAEIGRRVDKLSGLLEAHLKKDTTAALDALIERAQPKGGAGERAGGKIGVEGHRFFTQLQSARTKSESEVRGLQDAIESQLSGPLTDEERAGLLEEWGMLHAYGNFSEKSAAEMDTALRQAQGVYQNGRTQWNAVLEQRTQERSGLRSVAIEETGKTGGGRERQDALASESKAGQKLMFWEFLTHGHMSFASRLSRIFGVGKIMDRYERAILRAGHEKQSALRENHAALKEAMLSAFAVKSWWAAQDKLLELQEPREKTGVMRLEGRRSELRDFPVDVAQRIVDGDMSPDVHGLPDEKVSELADLLEQNETAEHPKRVLKLEVTTNEGRRVEQKLSELQAVHLTMLARNEQYRRAMERHGWDEAARGQLEAMLSPAAKALRAFLAKQYNEGYRGLNDVFKPLFGIDLPRVENYAPGYFEHEGAPSAMDPFGTGIDAGGMAAGFLKSRKNHLAEPTIIDALQAFWHHTMQTEHWKAYAPAVSEMRSVLGSVDVKHAVEARGGAQAFADLTNWMTKIEQGGARDAQGNRWLARLITAWTRARLAFNTGTLMKHLPNAFASLADVPAMEWMRGLGRVLTGQADTTLAELWKSDLIRNRIELSFAPDLRQIMKGPAAQGSLPRKVAVWPRRVGDFLDWGTARIPWVASAFTTFSAAIAHDYHLRSAIEAGMRPEAARLHAMEQTELTVARTAQPETVDRKSFAELDRQGIGKLMMMFVSPERQQLGIALAAVMNAREGKISKAEAARVLFSVWVVAPVIMQTMVGLAKYALTDEDAEEAWNWKRYAAAIAMGPAAGWFGIGQVVEAVAAHFKQEPTRAGNSPIDSAVSALWRLASQKDGGLEHEGKSHLRDIEKAASGLSEILSGATDIPMEAISVVDRLFRQAAHVLPDSEEDKLRKEKRVRQRERKKAREN